MMNAMKGRFIKFWQGRGIDGFHFLDRRKEGSLCCKNVAHAWMATNVRSSFKCRCSCFQGRLNLVDNPHDDDFGGRPQAGECRGHP